MGRGGCGDCGNGKRGRRRQLALTFGSFSGERRDGGRSVDKINPRGSSSSTSSTSTTTTTTFSRSTPRASFFGSARPTGFGQRQSLRRQKRKRQRLRRRRHVGHWRRQRQGRQRRLGRRGRRRGRRRRRFWGRRFLKRARGGAALNLASNLFKQASKATHHVAQAMRLTQRVFVVVVVLVALSKPGRGRGPFPSSSGRRRRAGRQGGGRGGRRSVGCHRSRLSSRNGRSFKGFQRRRLVACRVHRLLTLASFRCRLFISEFPRREPR
jgi:hypothetical protein